MPKLESSRWVLANSIRSKHCQINYLHNTINLVDNLYKQLPFAISFAPAIFQKLMSEIVQNCPAMCYRDDTLIYSKDESSHDKDVQEKLNKLRHAGVKLNKEKCEFRKEEIKFHGYVIKKENNKPDDDKVKTIQALEEPTTDISGFRSILCMVQYLARHIPCVTEVLHSLYYTYI